MANFRPVSNLSFLSKVVERAVARQLNEYINKNGLLPRYQSAFRRHHSTETAVLRVMSDVLTAADGQQVTPLGLLDNHVSSFRLCKPRSFASAAGETLRTQG